MPQRGLQDHTPFYPRGEQVVPYRSLTWKTDLLGPPGHGLQTLRQPNPTFSHVRSLSSLFEHSDRKLTNMMETYRLHTAVCLLSLKDGPSRKEKAKIHTCNPSTCTLGQDFKTTLGYIIKLCLNPPKKKKVSPSLLCPREAWGTFVHKAASCVLQCGSHHHNVTFTLRAEQLRVKNSTVMSSLPA